MVVYCVSVLPSEWTGDLLDIEDEWMYGLVKKQMCGWKQNLHKGTGINYCFLFSDLSLLQILETILTLSPTYRFRTQVHLYMVSILKALWRLVLHQQRDGDVEIAV